MPHQKLKREDYLNLGGIATKSSPYVTGPHQFLNLVNFDFSTPGSLTKRPGSTQYLATSSSFIGKVQGLFEFQQTGGFSQIIYAHTGSVWAIAASTITGVSLNALASTQTFFNGAVGYGWAGAYGWIDSQNTVTLTPRHVETMAATMYFHPATLAGGRKSLVLMQNSVFLCDGVNFLKWSGSTATMVGLPYPTATSKGSTVMSVPVKSASYTQAKYNIYLLAAQLINDRGFAGPIAYIGSGDYYSISVSILAMQFAVSTPLGFGITGVRFWGATAPGATGGGSLPPIGATIWNYDFRYWGEAPIMNGATVWQSYSIDPPVSFGKQIDNNPYWRGLTLLDATTSATLRAVQLMDAPQYLEVYNNQMITAGHSGSPSVVKISDIAEPENYDPENYIDVRTNDGDVITALKAYNSRLYVFKFGSMHELSGDDPTNFALREVTDQYGCVNHWSTATFNDTLLFLDRKGIMEFNGANITSLSNDIQPIIDRIAIESAKTEACMIHNPSANQVLCAVPVDGATMNNLTIVYDYMAKAFTTYDGYNPAIFALMKGRLGSRGVFYGGYTGMIFNFGASLMGDNGVAFTCLIKTRYLSDLGQSVQKQFRRLYLNVDVQSGQTIPVTVKGYPDYQTGASLSSVMYLTQFQKRLEFGVSAKSMAFEFSHYSATQGIRVHGWATESRFQRNV